MEKKYSNLFYLGPKSHDLIPYYINNLDVLIAFKKPSSARGGDSLKVYEYLATGKPVVTTSISPAKQFEELLYISDDKYKFSDYINEALQEEKKENKNRRIEEIQKFSWKNRTDIFIEKIQNIVKEND